MHPVEKRNYGLYWWPLLPSLPTGMALAWPGVVESFEEHCALPKAIWPSLLLVS